MSSLQCAYGISELNNFSKNINLKKKIGHFYNQKLSDVNFLKIPPKKNETSSNIYWVYPIIVNKKKVVNKTHFQKFLAKNGIITRDFFFPLSEQPFLNKYNIQKKKLKNSKFLYENGLYLPSGLGNSFGEFAKVCEKIKEYEKRYCK